MILVLQAHPYPDRSIAQRALAQAITGVVGVEVRSLYDLYPDFAIDVESEQEALLRAHTVVFQHPIYWYTAPALLKLWFEQVLAQGWAYGPGTRALAGKRCLWVVSTGGDEHSYSPGGVHGRAFETYAHVMRQTAIFCGMEWLPPIVVHAAHRVGSAALALTGQDYRARLEALLVHEPERAPETGAVHA